MVRRQRNDPVATENSGAKTKQAGLKDQSQNVHPKASAPVAILSFEEARRVVEQHAKEVAPTGIQTLELVLAHRRILSHEILADRDFPPFPRATRDGYAVRSADVQNVPATLAVVGEIKAGDSADGFTIARGQAVSIMTGASLPRGADAVVMVEHTAFRAKQVEIQRSVQSGENFVPAGAEARAGQAVLKSGQRLDHASIAIAASVGASRVPVFRRPKVAILSTGDELVEIDQKPGAAQIRNSNSYSLAAQVWDFGGEPVRLPIAADERNRLRDLIEKGLENDLLLLTGGVSMGKYDLVEQVLGELKAEFFFTGARIQPGKPVVFGRCAADSPSPIPGERYARHKYFFGLPGNPVSTMVTFELFVTPMLAALAGRKPEPLIFPRARLKSDVHSKTGLTRFLPAILTGEFDNPEVELATWQGSGDIAALARSNCYLVVPPDRERIEANQWVSLLMR
jgi:molybdopterin molybdotransferase